MTRNEEIEIMAAELARSEQMTLADCRRWIERCVAARDAVKRRVADDELAQHGFLAWRSASRGLSNVHHAIRRH